MEIILAPKLNNSQTVVIYRPDGSEIEIDYNEKKIYTSAKLSIDEKKAILYHWPDADIELSPEQAEVHKMAKCKRKHDPYDKFRLTKEKWYKVFNSKRQFGVMYVQVIDDENKKRFVPKDHFYK